MSACAFVSVCLCQRYIELLCLLYSSSMLCLILNDSKHIFDNLFFYTDLTSRNLWICNSLIGTVKNLSNY